MSTVGDNHSCLSWMFPASRKTEDIDRLLRRTIPACDPNAPGKMISFLGPEIPALFATAVECATFRSFNAKDAPPIAEWYANHLKYYKRWKREDVAQKIIQCIQEFLDKFPDAVSDGACSRRSTGILAPADDADEVEVEDASTMPP